jgi:hypothetical protein
MEIEQNTINIDVQAGGCNVFVTPTPISLDVYTIGVSVSVQSVPVSVSVLVGTNVSVQPNPIYVDVIFGATIEFPYSTLLIGLDWYDGEVGNLRSLINELGEYSIFWDITYAGFNITINNYKINADKTYFPNLVAWSEDYSTHIFWKVVIVGDNQIIFIPIILGSTEGFSGGFINQFIEIRVYK